MRVFRPNDPSLFGIRAAKYNVGTVLSLKSTFQFRISSGRDIPQVSEFDAIPPEFEGVSGASRARVVKILQLWDFVGTGGLDRAYLGALEWVVVRIDRAACRHLFEVNEPLLLLLLL